MSRGIDEEIDCVALSDAKVLITDDSGVGNEVVARAIHARSSRKNQPFVKVNCISLTESELFGRQGEPGQLRLAHRGTLFLDEVGEMSLRMQMMLLRSLATGEIQSLGSDRRANTSVDVRIIAATNRNLQDLIVQGQFREDLYIRLNVIHVHIPPSRLPG